MRSYKQVGGKEAFKRILTGELVLIDTINKKAYLKGTILRKTELILYETAEAFLEHGLLERLEQDKDSVGLYTYKCSIRLNIEVISLD